MKTSDEIKRGLECLVCYGLGCDGECDTCSKNTEYMGQEGLMQAALEYIRQLEEQNAEQAARLEQVTRERDAAVSDLAIACRDENCEVCAHYKFDDYYIMNRCELAWGECKFEWRGVQEGEHEDI